MSDHEEGDDDDSLYGGDHLSDGSAGVGSGGIPLASEFFDEDQVDALLEQYPPYSFQAGERTKKDMKKVTTTTCLHPFKRIWLEWTAKVPDPRTTTGWREVRFESYFRQYCGGSRSKQNDDKNNSGCIHHMMVARPSTRLHVPPGAYAVVTHDRRILDGAEFVDERTYQEAPKHAEGELSTDGESGGEGLDKAGRRKPTQWIGKQMSDHRLGGAQAGEMATGTSGAVAPPKRATGGYSRDHDNGEDAPEAAPQVPSVSHSLPPPLPIPMAPALLAEGGSEMDPLADAALIVAAAEEARQETKAETAPQEVKDSPSPAADLQHQLLLARDVERLAAAGADPGLLAPRAVVGAPAGGASPGGQLCQEEPCSALAVKVCAAKDCR